MSKRQKTNQASSLDAWIRKPVPEQNTPAASVDSSEEVQVVQTESTAPKQSSHVNSHRQSGIDNNWKKNFPWLQCTEDGKGMLCRYCIKYGMVPKNGTGTWVSSPCTFLVKESLVRHSKTKIHLEAADREATSILAGKGQGIQSALEKHVSLEKTALIGAFKCMFWLAKEEIPHTTHFSSLLDLAKSLGCHYLNLLNKGENANYTSQRTMQDILQCISGFIMDPLLNELQGSPFYSLMIDETTDVATMKQLNILARFYTKTYELKTAFLTLIDIKDGKADTIVAAIKDFMTKNNLPSQSFIGLGSDGASVMVGKHQGVAKQLRGLNSEMVNIHCIAHRLALAAAQAADEIPYLLKFKMILRQLFNFYQNSATRMSGLKEIENVLGDPSIKLREAADTRWLSHEAAVRAIHLCYPSLVLSLEREAAERSDATAAGLATFVKSPTFVCTIAMLSDTLPHLGRLSKAFQKKNVDFTLIEPLVSSTQMTLMHLLESPGIHMTDLSKQFKDLEEYGVRGNDDDISSFKRGIYQQFIKAVVENIHQRFPDVELFDAFSVFDPDFISNDDPTRYEWAQSEKLKKLSDQFPSLGQSEQLVTEFSSLRRIIANTMHGLTLTEVFKKIIALDKEESQLYPMCSKLCMIGLVLPVSTADCERCFSTLGRIKSILRNRLSQRVLNHLMTISSEGPSLDSFDFDGCVKAFGQIKKRRISVD